MFPMSTILLSDLHHARRSICPRSDSLLLSRTMFSIPCQFFANSGSISAILLSESNSVLSLISSGSSGIFVISLSVRSIVPNWSFVHARFSIYGILYPKARVSRTICLPRRSMWNSPTAFRYCDDFWMSSAVILIFKTKVKLINII